MASPLVCLPSAGVSPSGAAHHYLIFAESAQHQYRHRRTVRPASSIAHHVSERVLPEKASIGCVGDCVIHVDDCHPIRWISNRRHR